MAKEIGWEELALLVLWFCDSYSDKPAAIVTTKKDQCLSHNLETTVYFTSAWMIMKHNVFLFLN